MAATSFAPLPAPCPSVEEAIVLHLFDLANHLGRLGETLAARVGLTTQQWVVLLQVAGDSSFPGASGPDRQQDVLPSEIAEARGVTRASVSALVSILLRKGLVRIANDPSDRRRKRLTLTTFGQTALARTEPLRRNANQQLFAPLAPAERERFLEYLERCLTALDDAAHPGSPSPDKDDLT